jgi:hypothetical protein
MPCFNYYLGIHEVSFGETTEKQTNRHSTKWGQCRIYLTSWCFTDAVLTGCMKVWSCGGFEQYDVYTKIHENLSAGSKVYRETQTRKNAELTSLLFASRKVSRLQLIVCQPRMLSRYTDGLRTDGRSSIPGRDNRFLSIPQGPDRL